MTIFLYKEFTRNGKYALLNFAQYLDTKFGMNVSNELLLNAAKYQGYSFYRLYVSELFSKNQHWEGWWGA